ncbi:unnamed protein product, partial [Symbiodinium necroappetens]
MLASASRRVVVHQQLLPKSCLCGRLLQYSSRQDQTWWDEELDRRRRGNKVGRQEAVKQEERQAGIQLEAQRRPERQEIQQSAAEMQLFASAESQRPPWAVILLLLASGGLTAAATALWAKVSHSQSLEELQEELQNFCWVISGCSVSLPQLQAGEVHRLFAASLLRAGERPARLLADTILFFCCGTLLERLYGSTFLLQLILGSTVFSNVSALYLHQHFVAPSGDPPGSISSSSAAVVTLGTFCALRHGRWAAWRGVPVPISWLMAPVLELEESWPSPKGQPRPPQPPQKSQIAVASEARCLELQKSTPTHCKQVSKAFASQCSSSKEKRRAQAQEYRIPPPKTRMDAANAPPSITEAQKAASIERGGYLYATIDFTPAVQNAPWSTEAPAQYDYQTKSDISVTRSKTLPRGWELVKGPPGDDIKELIKIHPWGTHLLVTEGGNAYWTHAGDNPGAMEAIWDYDKYPGRYQLKPRYGRVSSWHGNFFIRLPTSRLHELTFMTLLFTGIQRSIALAACLAVEDAARSNFRPPAQDIVSWRIDLEITAEEDPPAAPEATVLADAVGALLGA